MNTLDTQKTFGGEMVELTAEQVEMVSGADRGDATVAGGIAGGGFGFNVGKNFGPWGAVIGTAVGTVAGGFAGYWGYEIGK